MNELQCLRCTFLNHASLPSCELCGAPLPAQRSQSPSWVDGRTPTSEPAVSKFENTGTLSGGGIASIKFSFRNGGGNIFHERLKGALTQRKWLLSSAPPIPSPINGRFHQENFKGASNQERENDTRIYSPGIAGLERRGIELRQKNEAVIGSAFLDLDALRASAKEIIALAESFASQASVSSTGSLGGQPDANQLIAESAKALDMVTTKDIAGTSASGRGNKALYLSEVARNLAEYLTDDSKRVLKRDGGIMSLVDLWALYNRARSEAGVDLVTPYEFEQAARLWERLRLPVRLRQFQNGLLVVQQADRTDDKTVAQLLGWLQGLHSTLTPTMEVHPEETASWDVERFGKGVTAQDTAHHFGWSVGVAAEELQMAEEKGALCRDEAGPTGIVTYWENWIVDLQETNDYDNDIVTGLFTADGDNIDNDKTIKQNLREIGIM